jgi:hypothetical protein
MYSDSVKKKGVKSRAARAEWRPEVEIFFLVGIVLATLLFVSPAMAQDGTAKIRMAHLSPDAPAVMVELDGEPVEALANVSYRDSSPYLDIPAGPHDVAVYAVADPSEPVLEVSIAPEAGESYTVAGVGLLADDTFGARLFEDDTTEPEEGEARVRVIHAVPDVGPATVSVEDGPDLFSLPGFANASDYVGVDAGTYTLEVTPAGAPEPAFEVPDVTVEEGEIYTAFAIGLASEGTLDTMITVDSDNGRVVGPQTLENTSGDRPLLEPQPESASASNERVADRIKPAGSSAPDATKEIEAPENTKEAEKPKEHEETSRAGNSRSEPSQAEPSRAEAFPQSEAPSSGGEAPVETETPVETYPASGSEPVYAQTAPAYAPPAETVSTNGITVPTIAEVSPEPLVVDTTVVPQPVQTLPAAPVAVPPVAVPQVPTPSVEAPSVPQIPVPSVETPSVVPQIPVPAVGTPSVPQVPVPGVEAPSIPQVSGSLSGQPTVPAQTVGGSVNSATTGVVAEGFVPTAPQTPAAPVGNQNGSQQGVLGGGGGGGGGGGAAPAAPAAPTAPVVGFIANTPAVVNSGPRRKFVTVRGTGRRWLANTV